VSTSAQTPGYLADLQGEADQLRAAAKWLLASLGAVAAVLVAGLQLAAIGSVPSGTRFLVAVAGAGAALGAVVVLILIVLEVLLPSDVTVEEIAGDKEGGRLRGYIGSHPSMLNGFANVDQLLEAHRAARQEAFDHWIALHAAEQEAKGRDDARVAQAEKAADAAEAFAEYVGMIVSYVITRLTMDGLLRRFDRKRKVLAVLLAVLVGVGVGVYAWGTNPPKSSSAVELRGANLERASLVGADLSNADLTGADLKGATLTGAKLDGVTWSDTVCPDGTNSDAHASTCAGHLTP
jgi:Pentapeptide repeats (8 copies)